MEAAAKTVELLSQRILPQEPHHLSYSPDWRYRTPLAKPNKPNKPARFDEWHNTRLQYLTFVSDADRGVLLTRPDYDMREEPPKPAPREVTALTKGGAEKKKLSLSDYNKKKTTGAISDSPPEPAIAKRNEAERASPSAVPASSVTPKPTSDPKKPSEIKRLDKSMPKERDSSADSKPSRRDNAADTKLPAKAPIKHPLPPKPPTPDIKKRAADADDEARPQKRPKPDVARALDDRPHLSRDDPPRRKDRDSLAPRERERDLTTHKDGKTFTPSSLPNGRSLLKDAMGSSRNPSPARSRGNSVNGVRSKTTESNRNTPSRADTSSKTSVPPLLSPLNLDLDSDEEQSKTKAEKRRRDETIEVARPVKSKKLEAPPPSRKRSPIRLPPLLSPTLPPEVEAELLRKKKDVKLREDTESPIPTKKARVEQVDDERDDRPQRKSLMVRLKVPKRLRQDFRRIMALSSRKEKDKEKDKDKERDKERDKEKDKDRPMSLEAPQASVSVARKRPSSAADVLPDPTATKRPRTSDMPGPARLAAPSTPSKKATAMSRVSSTNSQAHANTPGMGSQVTPSASSSDRNADDQAEVIVLKEREGRYSSLGKRLKHDGDEVMKSHHGSGATNGNVRPSESSIKLAHVLGLESFIAFMASFQTQNKHRQLVMKPSNPMGWVSMFALMEQRRTEMRSFPPLYALLLLLHAVALEEAVKCYWTFGDPSSQVSVRDIAKYERSRMKALSLLRETLASIDGPGLRLDVQPWSTVDEISEACLRVMRRYCADEKVDWRPEVDIKA